MTDPRASPKRPARWPWVLAVAAIGVALVALIVDAAGASVADALPQIGIFGGAIAALSLVGATLVSRVPSNSIGYLLLAAGALMSSAIGLGTYASVGVAAAGGPWPGVAVAALLNQVVFIPPIIITLVLVPLVFPDGHPLSPRWAGLVWITVLALVALAVTAILRPAALIAGIENPFAVPELAPLVSALDAYALITALIAFGGAVASIVIRFRRGDPMERQQLKWLLAPAGLAAVSFPMSAVVDELTANQAVADAFFLLTLIAFIALPVTIGIAVLRYRLYEIDRIVSRTIGWAIVSGVLAGAFILLVVGLQAVLAPLVGDNTVAVAASTLVVAALFSPLRSRVQRLVDHRFDRARYDGERLLESLGEQLRSEVDPGVIRRHVLATAVAAVRPTGAAMWLRPGPRR